MKKILLTGASGYIGSHLLNRLLDNNQYSISVIVRQTTNPKFIEKYKSRINFYEYKGIESLYNIMCDQENFDLIVHIAGFVKPGMKYEEVSSNIKGNVLLLSHLLESMRLCGISNIINTGSYWELGDKNKNVPKSVYAIYKKTNRNLIREYCDSFGFRAINLILYDIYGTNDERNKLIPFLIKVGNKKEIPMTKGYQKLSFIYIDDVVDAYMLAIERFLNAELNINNDTYYLHNNTLTSLRGLVSTIQELRRIVLNINWGDRQYNDFQIMTPYLPKDVLPKWKPSTELKEGLKKLIENE